MNVRHFGFLEPEHRDRLFHRPPAELRLDSAPELLATALGGTLYCPGNRPSLAKDVRKQAARGCVSMVLCLEDSIADDEVPAAEANVAAALRELHDDRDREGHAPLPLLFVRVRTPEQLVALADRLGDALDLLSGFVVPKFENHGGRAERFFAALESVQRTHGRTGADGGQRLRIMAILESPVMIHLETREQTLASILDVTRAHRDDVLALRIGATDLSSAFGLRRSKDFTVYDVKVVSAVIADIVNVLGRPGDDLVISGPVWEHFAKAERILKPQLRTTPFVTARERRLRERLVLKGLDGLIREITLDRANGLLGKTVIHPSHVSVVHALSVVTHEEYLDASAIVDGDAGGAHASPYGNKMNEHGPHRAWARKTLLRAEAFGVAAEETTVVDLLEASMR